MWVRTILIDIRPETSDATIVFFNAYRARSKPFATLPAFHVLKKHNHLRQVWKMLITDLVLTQSSNILSIGTEDTAQTDRILEFIHYCLEKKPNVKL